MNPNDPNWYINFPECDSEPNVEFWISECCCDNSSSEVDSVSSLGSAPFPEQRKRCPWGKRKDSRKTSQFRAYDISQSPALIYLQLSHLDVTKDVLIHLIETVVMFTPPNERPELPGRNMKRVKAGLVMWLDQHVMLVARYFHPLKEKIMDSPQCEPWKKPSSRHY
jgi:hypothetical protein